MITLRIYRDSLGLLPLVIADDGTGTYTLMPGYSEGTLVRDNTYAESRWYDGALLTSSRKAITSLEMTVRVNSTSLALLRAAIDELAEALDQFDYLVTVTETGLVTYYTAMPATWSRRFDRDNMRYYDDLLTISIPRQP